MGARPTAAAPAAIVSWSAWSFSPAPLDESALQPLERRVLARCGQGEVGLRDAARAVVSRKVHGLPAADIDAVTFAQRAAGEPHTWPRIWIASAGALESETTQQKLEAWLSAVPRPHRRCGAATALGPDGTGVLAVVEVDALADLGPLPTRARTGQWLTVDARMRVAASGGRVIVLGPMGAPRAVPTSFDGSTLHARFAPEGPGEHTVQVVADLESGPRPVLEATIFVDADPPADEPRRTAPGEDASDASGSSARSDSQADSDRIAGMLAVARASAGLRPLVRDRRLDAVALAHANEMARHQDLAHDVGDGGPLERLLGAGLEPKDTGENVAHAATLALAHRAQWWSPSHRANMLRPATDRLGVGTARDGRGDAWVVELFAGLP